MRKSKRPTKVREVQVTGSVATPLQIATWETELFVGAILSAEDEDVHVADDKQDVAHEKR